MKLGVAFTFVKMIFVAAYAPTNEFSQYALFLSLSYFLGYALSLGIVEGSVKIFPQLAADNKIDQVYSLAKKVIRRLTINSFLLFLFLAAASSFFQIHILQAFILSILALIGALTGLIASVHRAIDQPTKMAFSNFSRAFITFSSVLVIIFYSNVASSILLAEAIGGIVGVLISIKLAGMSIFALPLQKITDRSDWGELNKGGHFIALGYLLNSVPFYLDKWIANVLLSESECATYIYATTLMTVAVVIMNTISQLVGARLIKAIKVSSLRSTTRYTLIWVIIGIFAWGVFVISYLLLSEWQLLPSALSKYELSFEILFLLFILGVLYSSQLYEFVVIGLNLEIRFVQASIVHLFILVTLLTWIYLNDGELVELMISMIISRGFYLSLLLIFLSSKRETNGHSN